MSPPSRAAVITGAASGIGAATAKRLCGDGYHAWLADIDLDRVEQLARALRLTGGNASAVGVDVADEASVRNAFSTVATREPSIDVLINAAGIALVGDLETLTVEMWDRTFRVNVTGTFLCLQAALPGLRSAPAPARVINVASTAGRTAGPLTAPYHASKAAVISLTRSAAVALAPDILVNCVCPGLVSTPMLEQLTQQTAAVLRAQGKRRTVSSQSDSVDLSAEQLASVPINRRGLAEEVAGTIAFLAGPDATYMVGAAVEVNGGLALA